MLQKLKSLGVLEIYYTNVIIYISRLSVDY